MPTFPKYTYSALLLLTTAVYLLGAVAIDLMDVDASQYASIGREMRETGSFLQVYHRHENYLDKPPLLFWLSALSYGLFGVSAFAYRLPSFLFTLLGVFSTYRLGWLLYDRATGKIAALVLYTCQAYFLISHDVRTDTILANAVVFGTWQLTDYLRNRRPINGILAFVGFALAMLEKGPIGLMVPALAFASDWAYQRRWKLFFRWEWLAGSVLMLGLLAPMLWGLYRQFGAEGIRFFFWTQSFGRLTGENVWKDDSDALFFTHTFLWAFLPWMVLAYYGVATRLWNLVRAGFDRAADPEVLTLGGFLLPFIALSTSHYKLPHYIFVVFPFAALLTARVVGELLARVDAKPFRVFFSIQLLVALGVWLSAVLLCTLAFPLKNVWAWALAAAGFGCTLWFAARRQPAATRLVLPSAVAVVGANFLLNLHFYPTLLTYQSGSQAARYVASRPALLQSLYFFRYGSHAFDFYTRHITPNLPENEVATRPNAWVLTNAEGKDTLTQRRVPYTIEREFIDFHVTKLSLLFLNPATRASTLGRVYLLKMQPVRLPPALSDGISGGPATRVD